jgi:anti-anti-sigma regulatory factor
MAIKENSSNLLSKVAKFVRNPTTNWSDLDSVVPEAESGYTKQALKEMIERKRQNDFVRKREFDQLRKLRSRDPAARMDFAARPSFYQSSMPSNIGERADTLKKIDEIEAQMSKQWWKGKPGEPAQQGGNFPVSGAGAIQEPAKYATTQGGAVAHVAPAGEDFVATQMGPGHAGEAAGGGGHSPVLGPRVFDAKPSGFSTSKLFSIELSDDHTDADLEEAAIRFANGDDAGAEAGLIEALRSSSGQTGPEELWIAALFDFYRATGQQARFDGLALEFADRYGRSAPGWFSMREAVPEKPAVAEANPVSPSDIEHPIWVSPASLDLAAMGQLHLALANAPMPWSLNWSGLDEIEPNALHSLGQLFATWCSQQVRLRFDGVFTLLQVMMRHTPSGNKNTSVIWWRLRMDAMRILRMHDDFELLALDYCVTFEVSPPSWQDPRCEFQEVNRRRTGNTAPVSLHDILSESAQLGGTSQQHQHQHQHAVTALMGLDDAPVVVVELAGEIAGDAADALARLEVGRHEGAGRLVISCARLIRVDFSAAGSILNWAAQREEEGCNVQFREVHRLVGAFFNVIGINEHARVVLRSN